MMISAIQPDNDMQVHISIRPVIIPGDIRWLQQWIGVDANCLVPFYESLEASSFIQSMMVCDNSIPVFQVDICESLFDDMGAGDTIGPGDYSLRLLFAPDAQPAAMCQGLYNCIDYVFLEKKANRILIPVYKNNKVLQSWVTDAGFTLAKNVIPRPQYALYLLNRPASS